MKPTIGKDPVPDQDDDFKWPDGGYAMRGGCSGVGPKGGLLWPEPEWPDDRWPDSLSFRGPLLDRPKCKQQAKRLKKGNTLRLRLMARLIV